MASTQQIKRRIGSVKNTRQITKAMQLVSASKLRRAQDAAERPRRYTELALELLTKLRDVAEPGAHSFFKERPVKRRALVVIASDSGLAGAFNANVVKRMLEELRADKAAGIQTTMILVGRQVAQFAARIQGVDILGVYQDVAEDPRPNELRSLIATLFEQFNESQIDAVDVIYTHYISTVNQTVKARRVLPAGFRDVKVSSEVDLAEFEPSIDEVLERTVVRLVEAQIFQSMLDSFASEHAMRMLAMKNATDNASELVDDLTLAYNNARQAGITQELAEITGGAEAMK